MFVCVGGGGLSGRRGKGGQCCSSKKIRPIVHCYMLLQKLEPKVLLTAIQNNLTQKYFFLSSIENAKSSITVRHSALHT